MTLRFRILPLAGLLLAAGLAHAEIKVGVITSSTGPAAVVGIPQKNTVALLPSEIAGQKVDYIVLDDGSDPTNAVTNARTLLSEHKVDTLIGPSTTPAALAILDLIAEARTPLLTRRDLVALGVMVGRPFRPTIEGLKEARAFLDAEGD